MPWIKTISPNEAEGELADIYRTIGSARGGIADIHRVQSLNPRALQAHLEIYKAIVFGRSTLSRVARERIAVVVSAANHCAYCVAHHGEALRQLGEDQATVESLAGGELPPKLAAAELALLRRAYRAALSPADCTEASIRELVSLGFDDRAILDAALTVAYFSFVNRLVLSLGVEVEQGYAKSCNPMYQGAE